MENQTTILYVDDESINIYLFRRLMSRFNYNILTAESGEEGLEIMHGTPSIPLIISDMRMPGMNGVEFITLAKKISPATVCFLLTSYDITPDISKAMENKLVSRYIRKPFDQHQMHDFIRESINHS